MNTQMTAEDKSEQSFHAPSSSPYFDAYRHRKPTTSTHNPIMRGERERPPIADGRTDQAIVYGWSIRSRVPEGVDPRGEIGTAIFFFEDTT
jgi:hypothetical protein